MTLALLLVVGSYLVGSLSTAIITCKLMGLPDPREQGSGNPGATNVMRIGGKKPAAITLCGDLLKGLLPVLFARLLHVDPGVVAAVALAAFLGHLYPLYFSFSGGKGVATAAGAILGLSLGVALAAVISWLVMAKVTRTSSLSALVTAALCPFYLWVFDLPGSYIVVMLVMAALLIWRHRTNIERLLKGTEAKF